MFTDTDQIFQMVTNKDKKISTAKALLEVAISLSEKGLEINEKHRQDVLEQYKNIATKAEQEFGERSQHIVEFTEALKNVLANLKDEPVAEGGDILTDQRQMITIEEPMIQNRVKKGMFRK